MKSAQEILSEHIAKCHNNDKSTIHFKLSPRETIVIENAMQEFAAQQFKQSSSLKWVKASERLPETNMGVLVFIPDEDFHITSGMWDVSQKWVLLDEYRVPECEVTHWMELPQFPLSSLQPTTKKEREL